MSSEGRPITRSVPTSWHWQSFVECLSFRRSIPPQSKPPVKREFRSIISPFRSHTLPFSVGQVLDYFNEAFRIRPFRIEDKSFVYADRQNPDEVVIMTVSDLEASLGVVLLATGDYGMNYIREFFEAPFFLGQESEQLYALLDAGPGIRSVALERSNVQMRISEVGRWLVVALEFSPSEPSDLGSFIMRRGLGQIDECQFSGRNRQ